jgi:3'-phosphoadenosine 5'-phosphosulfate sulfotransferase (PAPS reductase)/FAD synthetase
VVRHILSVSGGKDSAALALHMRGRVPEMEYVFCDTGEELRETDDYLQRLEAVLGKPITWLNPDRPFRHYLDMYSGVLPDPRTRWCTRMLKIRPFERYVGDDPVISYIAIRFDERERKGYISTKPNIEVRYPFIENRMTREDVLSMLRESGLGLPSYYSWRSRSGCYFCFFQQRIEWVGLLENHPDLFEKAKELEKHDPVTGKRFTWVQGESLDELARPERITQIKRDSSNRAAHTKHAQRSLMDIFGDNDDDDAEMPCLICRL